MGNIWNKKMPTAFAFVLIIGTIIGTTFLVQTGVIYLGGAAPSDNPQNVRISNISDKSLTISYTTDAQVIGTVSIGKDKDNLQTILDERDQESGMPQSYKVHSITIQSLTPDTSYVFSITSGSTTYLNHDAYFSTKTTPTSSTPPTQQLPLTGKLIDPDGTNPKEAIVYITTDKGQLLSTLVKPSGIYTIPLNTYNSEDLITPFEFESSTQLHILATDSVFSSQATVPMSVSPVPLITLSQTYNFTTSTQAVASTSAEASIGFPAFATGSTLDATPVIITPQKDEAFTDNQPRFSGKALPNESVTVEIHSSDVITATVKADTSGNWSYRPTQQLSPGNHTLTIITKDANGIIKTIEQSFTVFAAGSQVNQSATPSATPVITNTPTPTIQPTNTPISATPTLQPSPILTPSPTPVKSAKITPKPTLPATGSNSLVFAGATGIVTTVIGIVLFLITRGAVL